MGSSLTSGTVSGILNEHPISIVAPGVLCLAEDDDMQVIEKHNVAAQSFSFHIEFLNTIAAYPIAIEELKKEKKMPVGIQIRQVKYLNNIVEQDHRFIKKRVLC